ncbi:MAG: BamA/TamA family outer membrane protein [Bacteroidales bacterium]
MKYLYFLCLSLLLNFNCLVAQDLPAVPTDSVITIVEDSSAVTPAKKPRNFRFSILGGPGYTPDFGFVIGGSSLLTFSTNPADTSLLRSVMPLAFALTFSSKVGFNLVFKPQFFFHSDKFRLMGNVMYKNTVDNYYGVGYKRNNSTERGAETTSFYNSMLQINPIAYFRLPETDVFLGPMVDFTYDKMTEISTGVANDSHYIQQGGTASGLDIFTLFLGMAVSYDTRDMPANAYRGVMFDLRFGYAPNFFNNGLDYGSIQFDYRQYFSVGNRRTLAWTVNTKNVFGNVPLTRLPFVGSPFDLRGYYLGQYRDKSTTLGVLEYRHMINTDKSTLIKRLANRVGFAAWGGAGIMGQSAIKLDAVLPNFGGGLRIEVQPRMNFRLDVGYSPLERQTLIYFNMTEAF